ncbi:MAG: phosphatidylserine decarboxylase [Clostridia bacterium]|nr:phosphatidylserine decarboxylase [Clostridia bacterium]
MKLKHRNGRLIELQDSQEKSLSILYGTVIGRMILKPLTAPCISKIAGKLLSTKASCALIKPFIKSNNIDMTQFVSESYGSYNDFFSRRIRPEARPVDMDESHLISPADSKLTAIKIGDDTRFAIKNTWYTVASLLKNDKLAEKYKGGHLLIFRLCVDDYHRYCYVADGEKDENVFIQGVLHTVNPIANDFYPIYKVNSREYTVLHTKSFGDITVMEVGALLVGKIVNHHGKASVKRGQEKGYFQFGGSTVVLLVEKDKIILDKDIEENSLANIETIVKFGEKVAVKK